MPLPRRVKRTRAGDFQLRLPPQERELLRSLPGQLRELLATDDPSVFRLFPSAYPDHPDRDAEYDVLTRDELLDHHRAALDTLEATVDADRVDRDQLGAWLGALNQLRLVLGTRLDVQEDMEPLERDDPRMPAFLLYDYLTILQEQVVDALSDD